MTDKINNQNMVENPDESGKLKPVKGSFKKIISTGAKIVIGGTVIAFVVSHFTRPRLLGVTRSARLRYEQRKAEIKKVMAAEIKKESEESIDEKTKAKH